MKKIVISCGPIPARLDSVKFITNRFKGGLAFKTARNLFNRGYEVTIIKWTHTEIPDSFKDIELINVNDVIEYYNWFKKNACNYDAFIMAGAVANLMPSNPYEGKFPSHNYSVGEKFDIEFEIAPRAIDIVKKLNPRCCLIGYKLFDANTDEELVGIARHTLKDSKANIIFANTPNQAKDRKIAVMQDNTCIPMTFDTHIEYIVRAIEAEYFTTQLEYNTLSEETKKQVEALKNVVEYFEKSFKTNGFGTVAVRVPGGGMVTTSRGHKQNIVYVHHIDFESRQIISDGKATLNAPLLWKMLEDNPDKDYVVHRHLDDSNAENNDNMIKVEYKFAGTSEELEAAEKLGCKDFIIDNHGYVKTYKFEDVDWNKYYMQFPSKYFSTPDTMLKCANEIIERSNDTLEVGSNTNCICKYSLDLNISCENSITYDDLSTMKFDLILLRNSINYLSESEIALLKQALKPNGIMLANGFAKAPNIKITDNEVSINDNMYIHHLLFIGDQAYYHKFFARGRDEYEKLGFNVNSYSDKSIQIIFKRGKK